MYRSTHLPDTRSCPSTLTTVPHPVHPGGWHDRAKWTGTSAPLPVQFRSSVPSHKIHPRPHNPGCPCLTLLFFRASGVLKWRQSDRSCALIGADALDRWPQLQPTWTFCQTMWCESQTCNWATSRDAQTHLYTFSAMAFTTHGSWGNRVLLLVLWSDQEL